ncbi:hypothetical protein ACFXK0_28950 [Nocardia sp. NPDC059177]|uniref:hypothetical protein n=1 Tax=Nocardia sp. NPDC059177 TaxID=3346759 RepID=UPI00367CDC71
MANVDFNTCPQALRLQATEVQQAADHWKEAKEAIAGTPMQADALGFFGTEIVSKFNTAAAGVIATKLIQGHISISNAAGSLDTCAKHFENLDAEWYRQFGYIDQRVGY